MYWEPGFRSPARSGSGNCPAICRSYATASAPYRRVYKPASAARCREPPFRHAPSLRLRRCGCLPSVTFRASLSSIRRSARRAIRASRCRSTPARSSVAGCRIPMPSRVPYSRPGSRFCGRFPPGHPRRSARCAPRPVRRPPCLRRVYAREPCRKAVRTALAQRCARPRRKGSPVFPGLYAEQIFGAGFGLEGAEPDGGRGALARGRRRHVETAGCNTPLSVDISQVKPKRSVGEKKLRLCTTTLPAARSSAVNPMGWNHICTPVPRASAYGRG